jgi:hypothetical protein
VQDGESFTLAARGQVWVSVDADPTTSGQVWVTQAGLWFSSSGSGRIPVPTTICRAVRWDSANSLALLECDFVAA